MKICITGGAGMIGSNLIRRLIRDKHEITVIDNLWRGKIENLYESDKSIIDLQNDFHNIDLSLANNLNAIVEIMSRSDILIHLADIVAGIGFVFNNQYEIFRQNVLINTNSFNAAKAAGIKKIIYVGTACSFPQELQRGLDSELKEDQLFPANPESAYGWSKLIGQLEIQYLAESSEMDISTLILHNVYGPYCEFSGDRTQVIPSLINRIIETDDGDVLEVWGSGNQGRAFIYVDDIAEAIAATLHKRNSTPYMQIGPNYCTSIKELVNTLISISGKKLQVFFDTSKPEGDKGRYADSSLAEENLGWTIGTNLNEGLERTYEWILKQKLL